MDSGADWESLQSSQFINTTTPGDTIYNVLDGGPGLRGMWGEERKSDTPTNLSPFSTAR